MVSKGMVQGVYSDISMTGGGLTEHNILHPKKYIDLILCTEKKHKTGNHTFGSCGNFGLNCVRTISLTEIRTQKNTRRFFRPKDIHG